MHKQKGNPGKFCLRWYVKKGSHQGNPHWLEKKNEDCLKENYEKKSEANINDKFSQLMRKGICEVKCVERGREYETGRRLK